MQNCLRGWTTEIMYKSSRIVADFCIMTHKYPETSNNISHGKKNWQEENMNITNLHIWPLNIANLHLWSLWTEFISNYHVSVSQSIITNIVCTRMSKLRINEITFLETLCYLVKRHYHQETNTLNMCRHSPSHFVDPVDSIGLALRVR